MLRRTINETFVDFIVDDPKVVFFGYSNERFKSPRVVDCACGIIGSIHKHSPCPVGYCSLYHFGQRHTARGGRIDDSGFASAKSDLFDITHPGRRKNDHLVARIDQTTEGGIDKGFCACSHDNLVSRERKRETLFIVCCDCFFQFRDTRCLGVMSVTRINGILCETYCRWRRVKVGFPCSERNDRFSFPFELFGFSRDSQGRGWFHSLGTLRKVQEQSTPSSSLFCLYSL